MITYLALGFWFFSGATLGGAVIALLSSRSYGKGYVDGYKRAEEIGRR